MSDSSRYARFSSKQNVKHFYNRFKIERAVFQHTLHESSPEIEKNCSEQYTSLLINRLLFLCFLQKKGLLDGDPCYLLHRLHLVQSSAGPNKFYRSFLLPLFHEGLALPQHSSERQRAFGKIPYLGAGLFIEHELEDADSLFNIADDAFERLFVFFNDYNWHLDEAFTAEDEINPTALGHLFEQYVNQQQMGAYYTRSDVTTYIGQNTIIPHLFDALDQDFALKEYTGESIWRLLQDSPDSYIASAIQCQHYLPTETEREYEARRHYYSEVKSKLVLGHIRSIDDLITYNLNILQFALDVIHAIADPNLLFRCYEQLKRIKILDPTCGSGAFLFAALQVLVPLYEACLHTYDKLSSPALLPQMSADLLQCSNRGYFTLNAIIVNNLYGIDIMEDAVEVCKLRLLLALFTQVECVDEIRPVTQLAHTIQVGNVVATPVEQAQTALLTVSPALQMQNERIDNHWQLAFKDILHNGGFDVILGNPPYVEFNEKTLPYKIGSFDTRVCSNLYTCIIERSRRLLSPSGRHGMILPLAAFATRNMLPFLDAFRLWFPVSWLSFYHFRPSMLFSGGKVASIATAIYLAKTTGAELRFSTQLLKWSQEQRDLLFSSLTYCKITAASDRQNRHYYPKFGTYQENAIMDKLLKHNVVSSYLSRIPNQNTMYYRTAGGLYWKVFVSFMWPYDTTSNKQCFFQERFDRDIFVALFNSSLFWWYYTVTFDTFNLKDYMLFGFRFSYPQDPALLSGLHSLSEQLMTDFRIHARHLKRGKTGSYTIYARKSKAIIDTIDYLLATHYGFTPEELDFILNYDIKYRMSMRDSPAITSREG